MARGFVYLTAVVDWASRKVLARRVAITMEAIHAVEALEEAFAKYGQPEIVNTDQGSQGGFNRSSQHQIVERILGTRPELRQAFSSRAFSGAWYLMFEQRLGSPEHSTGTDLCP
ncbi:transposase InsO family protein [Paraburkholderia sp. JPY419]